MAIANRAICETFEQTCIAWQAIPHWDTGDPGQSRVHNDIVNKPGFLRIRSRQVGFRVTLVQTSEPTLDSLIAEVNWAATRLARRVDNRVIRSLRVNVPGSATFTFAATSAQVLLDNLIDARAKVEDAGYRAPACLITNTKGLKYLTDLTAGYPITNELLASAHVNSLHRASQLNRRLDEVGSNGLPTGQKKAGTVMLMIGRRQLIAHAGAPDASGGEEPVDLAISVPPSLEVLGETTNSRIEMAVRIRFALRIKERRALAALYGKPVQ
ncbi:hypothetical protein [Mycolicibacterium sp. HK-90]|uniref:hypothetical protein n=1 Tax=Mycolicibacterium sp. HK-90 TaxID=3056937 RepID=UPI00265B0665|nr:hypothetical protein [Mycolicibacterium sp. HK-90]WKG06109.1 hypothetical protein QU592_13990 [Mycolicibacterium sp. HK-90]